MKRVGPIVGVGLSISVAFLFVLAFRDTRVEPVVPLFFLFVILSIAVYFGGGAGMLGTLVASLIFMQFLFKPIHAFAVQNPEERSNLIWMFLGGLALSSLFATPPSSNNRKPTT